MRTQKKNIFKTVGLIAMTLFLVSCGKDNKSGGNNGLYQGFNQAALQSVTATCSSKGGVLRTFQIPANANAPGEAIGITSEGSSVRIVSNGNGQAQLILSLCQPAGVTFVGQPQISSQGVLTYSGCQGLMYVNGMQAHIMATAGNGYNNGYGNTVRFDYAFRDPFQQCNPGSSTYPAYGW